MLLRGITWTRETVAQVETTNRRLGFTEAIVVALEEAWSETWPLAEALRSE